MAKKGPRTPKAKIAFSVEGINPFSPDDQDAVLNAVEAQIASIVSKRITNIHIDVETRTRGLLAMKVDPKEAAFIIPVLDQKTLGGGKLAYREDKSDDLSSF